jgi:agmatine deiminase
MNEMARIDPPVRIPAEWEPHACCVMAWAAVCAKEWEVPLGKVEDELADVIRKIAEFEPVRLLTPQSSPAETRFRGCANIEIVPAPVDDIWMRDIAPTFAIKTNGASEEVVAIDWNFNSWGGTKDRSPRTGDALGRNAEALFGFPRISASFVGEGGALITDGAGTVVTTRSCLLNPNRNPFRDADREAAIEADLARFGVRRVVWLEGDPCEPITSGHVDGYVLLAPNGVVLVEGGDPGSETPRWREHDIAALEAAVNANGARFEVRRVLPPRENVVRESGRTYWKKYSRFFAPCYLNAYVANGAVIGASFGAEERDELARQELARAFPGREVVLLDIDAIATGGGGIHCLTQPIPAVN